MQADRRLVEHVEHAREPRADLGREPDPLALAAGERGGLAVEGEVAEAHLVEKREPAGDLLHQFDGDQPLRVVEDEGREKLAGFGDRQAAERVERELRGTPLGILLRRGQPGLRRRRDPHGTGLRREPLALAVVAGRHAHQLLEHPTDDAALRRPPAVGEQAAEPLELRLRAPLGPSPLPGEFDLFEAGAAQPELLLRGGEVVPGRVEQRARCELLLRLHVGGHADQEPPQPAGHVADRAEHADRPFAERLLGLGDELGRVDAVDVAEALAGRAGALRAVEAEQLRLGRGVAHAAGGARVLAGEHEVGKRCLPPFLRSTSAGLAGRGRAPVGGREKVAGTFFGRRLRCHDHLAAGGLESECHGLGQPAPRGVARHEPIDDHVDRVLELLLERGRILDAAHAAIDPGPRESLADEVGKEIAVLPLGVADERREQHHRHARPGPDDSLHDLVAGLGLEHGVALGAVGRAHPRVEHAEEVVDLRHRGDGRARVGAGRLLRDRDRRGEAGHAVDVGPGQLPEELPGERGEALDVAPLALGVERVEGEARLARAAHAREADEPTPGQADRDVAEVVFAGSADDDRRDMHERLGSRGAGRDGRSIVALDSPRRVPYDRVSHGKNGCMAVPGTGR